jgi:hypothetical protein
MGLAVIGGPVMPGSTTNDCLDGLVTLIEGVSGIDGVYGYRTAKTELEVTAVVTAISDVLTDTPDGLEMGYDFIVDVLVRIDGEYEAAERALNSVTDGIWRAIWGANEPVWNDCYPYAATQKPASPQELVNFRRGILYVRVIPN